MRCLHGSFVYLLCAFLNIRYGKLQPVAGNAPSVDQLNVPINFSFFDDVERGDGVYGDSCTDDSDCTEFYVCMFDPLKADHLSVLEWLKGTCQLGTPSKTSTTTNSRLLTVGIILGVLAIGVLITYLAYKSYMCGSCDDSSPRASSPTTEPPQRTSSSTTMRPQGNSSSTTVDDGRYRCTQSATHPISRNQRPRNRIPSALPDDTDSTDVFDVPPSYLDAISDSQSVVAKSEDPLLDKDPPSYSSVQIGGK